MRQLRLFALFFFFFNDTATTEIYTLSLHNALPIYEPDHRDDACARDRRRGDRGHALLGRRGDEAERVRFRAHDVQDRKSTRLNSSHANISYAVFCLKKKNKQMYYLSLTITEHHMPQ